VYTAIVPVVPIARLQATVFSKVCETVRLDVLVFSHINHINQAELLLLVLFPLYLIFRVTHSLGKPGKVRELQSGQGKWEKSGEPQ